jgi:hypothetical protein
MAKQKKSTKKFQKKHLKSDIQRRKKFKVFKKNKDRRENVAGEVEGGPTRGWSITLST